MTKRQITKEAYRRIVKENESHQTVYDDLKTQTKVGWDEVAKIVGNTPSQYKREQNKGLVYTYVALMGVIIILRSLGIFVLVGNGNAPMLLLFVALGLVVPAIGIYGAMTYRIPIYYSTAGLLAIGLFRSISKESGFMDNPINLIVLIPFVAVIVLSLVLPYRLKTDHKMKVVEVDVDGVKKKTQKVVFETEDTFSTSDVLDR